MSKKYKTPEEHVNRSMYTEVGKKNRKSQTEDYPTRELNIRSSMKYRDREVAPYQEWGRLGYKGKRHQFHYDAFIAYWRGLEAKYPQRRSSNYCGDDPEHLHKMHLRFLEAIVETSDLKIKGKQEKRAIRIWFKGIENFRKLRKGVRNTQTERPTIEDADTTVEKWESVRSKVNEAIRDAMGKPTMK